MDHLIKKTLQLVYSSSRPMPAHFTQNGDRNQSFCIDFEPLTKDDDEAMASEAWGSTSDFLSVDKCGDEVLDKSQLNMITRVGEDLMAGAFILTKLNGNLLMSEMKKAIIDDTIEAFKDRVNNTEKVFAGKQVNKYFDHCVEYGHGRAA
jgi:hypothetical protein